jgi:hypothetical protein
MPTEPAKPVNAFVRDERSIDLNDAAEVLYWTKFFDITEYALHAAVGAVGNTAQDVKDYLARLGPAP